MSVVVFLSVQLCGLLPITLGYPLIPLSEKLYAETRDRSSSLSYLGDTVGSVKIQNWERTVLNSHTGDQRQPFPQSASLQSPSSQARANVLPFYSHVAKASSSRPKSPLTISGDSYNSIAQADNKNSPDTQTVYKNNATSKSAWKSQSNKTTSSVRSAVNDVLQFHSSHSDSGKLKVKTADQQNAVFSEYAMPADQPHSLQLAVEKRNEGEGQTGASQAMISVASSLVVLLSLGVIIGIFGCCCKKQQQADENENKNGKQSTENDEGGFGDKIANDNKKPSEIFNPSDIPSGEKDLDEPVSVKDKVKAFDNKLIIQPSPDHIAKRKSQTDVNLTENKAYFSNNVNQPQILISEEDNILRDKSKSKSIGDNISKSDTQDDISDKIFDNISTHSSISQPHNPDVVIADTDDESEFAEIQRGTVILKSFQRAKPPRNRSPATRTSKGKIRKSRPNLDRSTDQDKSKSREASKDREQASMTSSLSLSPSQGTSSKTNSLDKLDKPVDKKEQSVVGVNMSDSPMTKSSDFSDFDSIMSQSITSIGSDIVGNSKRHESPVSARYKKSKDSPKSERAARTDSPARVTKSKEREVIGKESRTESPSRYKKNTDSPKSKHKHRRRDRDRDLEQQNGKSDMTSESSGKDVGNTNSAPHRLSGIPASMNNNIFYLIDPTVKNKCKSVGELAHANKRKSGDYSKRKSGDYSHRKSGDYSREGAKASKHKVKDSDDKPDGTTEAVSPEKRERTQSDPSRKSKEVENTQL